MPYTRTNWIEDSTPLSADNMNNIEEGIAEAKAAVKPINIKTTILDIFYPVGSYYETSDANFNPNTSWGGTWTKVDAGRSLIAAGSGYALGSTGGAATVTLTTNEMPVHTHTQNSHNHTQNSHNHTQNSHNHTQNSHNHTQNAHNHGHADGESCAFMAAIDAQVSNDATNQHLPGQGSPSYIYPWNYGGFEAAYKTAKTTATNNATTATNKAATATNQATTATNNATTATNQNTGGGKAHNNMPPYVAVNIWHRTA